MALQGEAKKAYQRELMRKRREETRLKAIFGSDCPAELAKRLPWPLNSAKSPRWGEGVPLYIAPTEDEKKAVDELNLLNSEKLRAERNSEPK